MLTEELGPLSELDERFCQTVSVLDLGPLMRRFAWIVHGCLPHERTWLFNAFLAKSVYQFPTTEALLDALQTHLRLRQLCGWESATEVSSATEAPGRPAPESAPDLAALRRRGRPKRGEIRPPAPPQRLDVQDQRILAADLPVACDVGCKRNRKGHQEG